MSGDVPVTKTSLPQTPSKVVSGDAGCVDLIVLPEMFTTGFCTDPSHTADVIDDGAAAVAWMRRMAERYDAAVTGSVAVADGERYFN
ncbi:nitrilase-related carbon-nitrogen hydrolase, partial [Alistipes putredinis]|uniref:nitrilase-related carbon-nitrogen hydrolase n=1 Tax=Alistipes putredinis TaxID=28117 RepID=UPI00241FCFB8